MISSKKDIIVEPGESILFTWDFGELLATGETLTGTPTVTCTRAVGGKPVAAATGDLTISSKAVNAATVDDGEGGTVGIGDGVQARIIGFLAGGTYSVRAQCGTTGGNTLARIGRIVCQVE